MLKTAAISLLLGNALAGPAKLGKRQCPNIQVFGARETTAPAGYGSSITVVDDVLSAYSGSTAEAIDYPACGGQSTCGGISYADSVVDGISAVIEAVNSFNSECPDSQIVLVGYSQVCSSFKDSLNSFFLGINRGLTIKYLRVVKSSTMLYAEVAIRMKVTTIQPSHFQRRPST